MESHSITINPIIEKNKDLPIEKEVQYLDDPIECNVCVNITACICVMVFLFMLFLILGGYGLFINYSDDGV
jgi:hypothetical protein